MAMNIDSQDQRIEIPLSETPKYYQRAVAKAKKKIFMELRQKLKKGTRQMQEIATKDQKIINELEAKIEATSEPKKASLIRQLQPSVSI